MLNTEEIARLTPAQVKAYEGGSLIDRAKYAGNWRASGSFLSDGKPKPPTSIMRLVGSIGTVAFGLLAFFAAVVSGSGTGGGDSFVWVVLFSSLFGLCVFMWMLGAIEQRLIAINETLKARS